MPKVLGGTLLSEDWPSCSLAGKTGSCVCDCVKTVGVFQTRDKDTESGGRSEGHFTLVWVATKTSPEMNGWGQGNLNKFEDGQCEQHTSGRGDEEGECPQQEVNKSSSAWMEQRWLQEGTLKGGQAAHRGSSLSKSLFRVCPVFREP